MEYRNLKQFSFRIARPRSPIPAFHVRLSASILDSRLGRLYRCRGSAASHIEKHTSCPFSCPRHFLLDCIPIQFAALHLTIFDSRDE